MTNDRKGEYTVISYFEYTGEDKGFYEKKIKPRIPSRIFDIHVHINLPEHVKIVTQERIRSDWALECGHILTTEEAYSYADTLLPDAQYAISGFPWPIREADLTANNTYLAEMRKEGRLSPFMCVMPDWDIEEVEKNLVEGGFFGFKPYPDMVSGIKGADISIFDFLPHAQLEILNRHKKAVMLHLPRKGRLADDQNVKELLEMRDRYPDITIIIAHLGRSFCPVYLDTGLNKLGDAQGFYFDTSAVINPDVYTIAFDNIPPENILYGSDMPITLWHGKREWTETGYTNICREDFSWKTRHMPVDIETGYVVFLYEEIRAILDALERHYPGGQEKEQIFFRNAERILGL